MSSEETQEAHRARGFTGGRIYWVKRRVVVDAETGKDKDKDIDSRELTHLLNCLRATEIEVGLLFTFTATAQSALTGSRMRERSREIRVNS